MRRFVTIGSIVITTVLGGSMAAFADPPAPPASAAAPADCVPAVPVPAPVVPGPVVPAPVMPAPVEPAPVIPAPVIPAPVIPAPVVPAPVVPAPVVPAPAPVVPPQPAPPVAPGSTILMNPILINPVLINPTIIYQLPAPAPAVDPAVSPVNQGVPTVDPVPAVVTDPVVADPVAPVPVPAPAPGTPVGAATPVTEGAATDSDNRDAATSTAEDPMSGDVIAGAAAAPTDPAPADSCTPTDDPSRPAGYATSAAAKFGWGTPNRVEDFSAPLGDAWNLYDGVGHAGNGRRTPDAVSVKDGLLTITGDPQGSTEGMAWGEGQKYGRWEGRVKAPVSDKSYNALLLLWPDAENFPVGGEVDFMEMSDHTRQKTEMFLHYGSDNSQVSGSVNIDATQWHNWAVEWTPDHIATFVDGKEWFRTTDKSILPPGPMHMTIQLDWFPKGGDVQESHMYVDWVKQYPLNSTAATEGAVQKAGQAVAGVTDTVTQVVEGAADTVAAATAPLTEGAPDAVPTRQGLVPMAVPAAEG